MGKEVYHMDKKKKIRRRDDSDVQVIIKSEKTPDDIILGEKMITAADVLKQLSANRKKRNSFGKKRK